MDANNILIEIENYLKHINLDNDIMDKVSSSDRKFLNNAWDLKLKDNLNDLIANNKMSNLSYSILRDIFEALKSNKYDIANKKITEITKNTKEFKQNKKWIMTFKSIVRIAKQYDI